MKTEITADGHLNIAAETPTESYALKKFYEENFDDDEKQLRGDNIFFDWTEHPAPNPVSTTWEHHITPCMACSGTGKLFDSTSSMCPNCSGTGNIWV